MAKTPKTKNLVFDLEANELTNDWIRAVRLAKAARGGDKDAKAKMKELENTKTVKVTMD